MKHLRNSLRLVPLVALLISCAHTPVSSPTVCPALPSPPKSEACTLTEAPPQVPDAQITDYGRPGDPDCGESFEVCLSRKTAKHYLDLINYAEAVWARCQSKN